MAEGIESLDVSDEPELRELAESIWSSHEARVLRRGRTALVLVMPLGVKHSQTSEGKTEFVRAAGAWQHVDTDAFLIANRKSRAASYRPPVDW